MTNYIRRDLQPVELQNPAVLRRGDYRRTLKIASRRWRFWARLAQGAGQTALLWENGVALPCCFLRRCSASFFWSRALRNRSMKGALSVNGWRLLSILDEPIRTAAHVLLEALSDSDAYARSQAALQLAAGEKDIELRLILTLPHASPKMMAGTAYSLGHATQRPELAVPLLMDCLEDPSTSVRQAAATALGRFGEHAAPALPRLRLLMNDTTRSVRKAAMDAVTEIIASELASPK